MKLDLDKINNIKSKLDLKKFKINEPLFFNNYLFHYLIIFDKLDILKLDEWPLYKENDEGLNGFFLAAKYNNIKILTHFITKYKKYIYNKNDDNKMFIDYLAYSNILKIINLNLDWDILFKNKLDDILYNLNYQDLLKIFKIYKLENKCLHMIVINPKLNTEQIINILNLFPNEVKLKNNMDQSLIFPVLHINNIKIVKYLISKNIDIDYYTVINTFHPLKTALHIGFMEAYNLIWDHIKSTFNYDLTNKNLENIAHFLLNRGFTDKTSYDILTHSPSSIWHQLDINKRSPLELIISYNFSHFKNILKNKKVNLKYIRNTNYTSSSINSHKIKPYNKNTELWITFLKKLPVYHENNDIIIKEYPYYHYNSFQSTFIDMCFFVLHLNKKYKNVYFPNIINYKILNTNDMDDINLKWPDKILDTNPIFPWIICYKNENEYWIHSELNNLINSIRRSKKYDFIICFLSLQNNKGDLHANIIIYDLNNLTIERFDPYGNFSYFEKYLDDTLEEELTWNTGLKYLKASDFMPVASFQTISDELDPLKQKNGDFGGYCLAWCTWYLEHRVINIHIKPKDLIIKLIKKLSLSKYSFMEIIRNYANKLIIGRNNLLLKLGLNKNIISNMIFDTNTQNKINDYIINNFSKEIK